MRLTMQSLAAIVANALAVALSAISIACAYRFGLHLGGQDEALLYAALGATADAFKALLPLAISSAWISRQRGKAAIAAAVFIVFSGYSFASEIGLYALAKASQTGTGAAAKERYGEFKAELGSVRDRLRAL